ncbi:hypothetical protein ABK040_012964 [Willaertia magna]
MISDLNKRQAFINNIEKEIKASREREEAILYRLDKTKGEDIKLLKRLTKLQKFETKYVNTKFVYNKVTSNSDNINMKVSKETDIFRCKNKEETINNSQKVIENNWIKVISKKQKLKSIYNTKKLNQNNKVRMNNKNNNEQKEWVIPIQQKLFLYFPNSLNAEEEQQVYRMTDTTKICNVEVKDRSMVLSFLKKEYRDKVIVDSTFNGIALLDKGYFVDDVVNFELKALREEAFNMINYIKIRNLWGQISSFTFRKDKLEKHKVIVQIASPNKLILDAIKDNKYGSITVLNRNVPRLKLHVKEPVEKKIVIEGIYKLYNTLAIGEEFSNLSLELVEEDIMIKQYKTSKGHIRFNYLIKLDSITIYKKLEDQIVNLGKGINIKLECEFKKENIIAGKTERSKETNNKLNHAKINKMKKLIETENQKNDALVLEETQYSNNNNNNSLIECQQITPNDNVNINEELSIKDTLLAILESSNKQNNNINILNNNIVSIKDNQVIMSQRIDIIEYNQTRSNERILEIENRFNGKSKRKANKDLEEIIPPNKESSINMQGFKADKSEYLAKMFLKENIDILAYQESALDTKIPLHVNVIKKVSKNISSYNAYNSKHGLGFLVNIKMKNNFIINFYNLVENRLCLLTLFSKNFKFIILNVYNNAKSSVTTNDTDLVRIIKNLTLEYSDYTQIFMGDFNATLDPNIKKQFSSKDKFWIEFSKKYNLFRGHFTNEEQPTFIRKSKKSRPDNVFSNCFTSLIEIVNYNFSDHELLTFTIESSFRNQKKINKFIPKRAISEIIKNTEINIENMEFIELLKVELKEMKKQQISYYQDIKENQTKMEKETFLKLNELNKKIKYEENLEEREIMKTQKYKIRKDYLKLQKTRLRKSKTKKLKKINQFTNYKLFHFDKMLKKRNVNWNNIKINNSNNVEQELRKYYIEKFKSNSELSIKPNSKYTESEVKLTEITIEEVRKVINNSKSKSLDAFNIDFKFYRNRSDRFYEKLTSLCNNVMNNQINLPSTFKKSWIKLIGKTNNPNKPKDLRPISILPVIYRIISKSITNKFNEFLDKFNWRIRGFLKGRNPIDISLLIKGIINRNKNTKNKEERYPTYVGYLDIDAAYDNVEYSAIKTALIEFGINKEQGKAIVKMIKDHSFTLEIFGNIGKFDRRNKGLPQGDPISPIFFNILTTSILKRFIEMNYLKDNSVATDNIGLLCYADDFIVISSDWSEFCKKFQSLKNILEEFGMKMSIEKSGYIVCNKQRSKRQLKFNDNSIITRKDNVEILGSYVKEGKESFIKQKELVEEVKLITKFLPVTKIQPYRLNQIISSKIYSKIAYLARTEVICRSVIINIDTAVRSVIKAKLAIDKRLPSVNFYRNYEQDGFKLNSVEQTIHNNMMGTFFKYINHQDNIIRDNFRSNIQIERRKLQRIKSMEGVKEFFKQITYMVDKSFYQKTGKVNTKKVESKIKQFQKMEIYTDGSAKEHLVGGGVVFRGYRNNKWYIIKKKYNFGKGTNNKGEIGTIAQVMKELPNKTKAIVKTDSQITISLLNNEKYKGVFQLIKNTIKEIIKDKKLDIEWEHVRSHTNNKYNDIADELANMGRLNGLNIDIQNLISNKYIYLIPKVNREDKIIEHIETLNGYRNYVNFKNIINIDTIPFITNLGCPTMKYRLLAYRQEGLIEIPYGKVIKKCEHCNDNDLTVKHILECKYYDYFDKWRNKENENYNVLFNNQGKIEIEKLKLLNIEWELLCKTIKDSSNENIFIGIKEAERKIKIQQDARKKKYIKEQLRKNKEANNIKQIEEEFDKDSKEIMKRQCKLNILNRITKPYLIHINEIVLASFRFQELVEEILKLVSNYKPSKYKKRNTKKIVNNPITNTNTVNTFSVNSVTFNINDQEEDEISLVHSEDLNYLTNFLNTFYNSVME